MLPSLARLVPTGGGVNGGGQSHQQLRADYKKAEEEAEEEKTYVCKERRTRYRGAQKARPILVRPSALYVVRGR